MTKPRRDAAEHWTRTRKKPAFTVASRDEKAFVRLAHRLVHSSDASERSRLKKKLARKTFGE